MPITNQQIGNRFDEAIIRIESMLHIGGMGDPGDISTFDGPVQDFIDDMDNEINFTRIKKDMPFLKWNEDQSPELEEFFWHVRDHGKWGFLVKVGHPCMGYTKGTDGASFSWGQYRTTWFYGDSLAEIVPKAEAWVAEVDAADKAKVEAE